jgi:hypothetical protein
MISLLLNKKTAAIFSLILPFFLTNYAIADKDISFENLVIIDHPSDNTYFAGDSFKTRCYIKNVGDEVINYSTSNVIRIYAGEYHIGSIYSPTIKVGEEKTADINCTLPINMSVGSYNIWGKIFINDSNPDNNTCISSTDIIVTLRPPDISITSINMSGDRFVQGDTISVNTSIKNVGYQTAEDICLEYYANECLVGSTNRSGLEPGATDTFTFGCQIPDDLPDGYYSLGATVTCTNDKNADNNSKGTGTTFWVGKVADLTVKTIQAPNGTYMPGNTIEIYSLVENAGDKVSNAYTIDYYLSADKNIAATDYNIGQVKRNALQPGQQHSYNTNFKLPPNIPAANYYVGIKITCQGDANLENNSGYDNETLGITHPANYVFGKVKYDYQNNSAQPVRYALLKVYDKNSATSNREIGHTITDENGNYGLVVLYDGNSGQNIYVEVSSDTISGACPGTKGKICSVKSESNNMLFIYKSLEYSHPHNLSRNIDVLMPASWRPFLVFDSMVEAFIKAKTYFDIEMEEITAYWPSSNNGTYYYPSNGIFIAKDDEWDRDIILHEYGHYIAEVYNFAQGDVGENPTHYWDKDLRFNPVQRTNEHASNLGFRESWPTLFSIACQYIQSVYPRSGDTKYQDYYSAYQWSYEIDLEEDTLDNSSPGEYYDNMNCCLLWDIFDNNPDSISFNETVSDPNLSRIWTIMRGYAPENINDFWIGWYHRFGQNNDIQGVADIFKKHRMSFAESGQNPVLPQNHAPVAVAGPDKSVQQNRTEGAQVHLDASGSYDTDGDPLSYIWRYGYTQYNGAQLDIVLPVGQNELELEVSDGKITSWDTVIVTVTPR